MGVCISSENIGGMGKQKEVGSELVKHHGAEQLNSTFKPKVLIIKIHKIINSQMSSFLLCLGSLSQQRTDFSNKMIR